MPNGSKTWNACVLLSIYMYCMRNTKGINFMSSTINHMSWTWLDFIVSWFFCTEHPLYIISVGYLIKNATPIIRVRYKVMSLSDGLSSKKYYTCVLFARPTHNRQHFLLVWLIYYLRRHSSVIITIVCLEPLYYEGILPKGPYLPCVSMAGRALLAGYPRL